MPFIGRGGSSPPPDTTLIIDLPLLTCAYRCESKLYPCRASRETAGRSPWGFNTGQSERSSRNRRHQRIIGPPYRRRHQPIASTAGNPGYTASEGGSNAETGPAPELFTGARHPPRRRHRACRARSHHPYESARPHTRRGSSIAGSPHQPRNQAAIAEPAKQMTIPTAQTDAVEFHFRVPAGGRGAVRVGQHRCWHRQTHNQ